MNSPLKPWERNIPIKLQESDPQCSTANACNTAAPPLPPRPASMVNQASNYYANRYSSPYSSYGYGCSPYGFNGFGQNFGYFGSAMGGYPGGYCNPSNEMTFFRLAEESTRHAFQSIESIVQAFSSVSMLLESTYFTLRNSFQAIVGVADNFSSLRNQLATLVSTLAIVRMLKNLVNYVLNLIGVRKTPSLNESIWSETETSGQNGISLDEQIAAFQQSNPTWPLLLFFGLVCGTPWVIWKMFKQSDEQQKLEQNKWKTGESSHYIAIGLFEFNSESDQEVSFKSGQLIRIAPKELQPNVQGWLLACVNSKTGLVPANRIKIVKFHDKNVTHLTE